MSYYYSSVSFCNFAAAERLVDLENCQAKLETVTRNLETEKLKTKSLEEELGLYKV